MNDLLVKYAACGAGAWLALAGLGCGGSPRPADTASAPPSDSAALPEPPAIASSPPPAASSAQPAAEPPAGPLTQVLETNSGQIQKIFEAASAAPAATLKPAGATGSDVLAKGVRDSAKKLSAGMQPDGPMAMGSLKEKGHLQTDVTLMPGKCYAIVGYSQKVKDLDLYLLLPPGVLSGQDLSDDNHPIVGGAAQPMCPVASAAITYKVDIYAEKGAGDVAVQLFSKGQ